MAECSCNGVKTACNCLSGDKQNGNDAPEKIEERVCKAYAEILEKRIAELIKERDEHDEKRREAYGKVELWRSRSFRYRSALFNIKKIMSSRLPPDEERPKTKLVLYEALEYQGEDE